VGTCVEGDKMRGKGARPSEKRVPRGGIGARNEKPFPRQRGFGLGLE